ncbi:MAG: ATP-binding protein [Bernardetiaceae bacterium]|nr:ATP-binding protein [Bernardetiaceae bacterium]
MAKRIQIPCLKNNLKKVRDFVESFLKDHNVSAMDIQLMVLAVDELCANVIIHSHNCNPRDHIEVSVTNKDNNFVFEIRDSHDAPFNYEDYKAPEMQEVIKERRGSGMGLILVRNIVDEIQYERDGTNNICRVSKRFSPYDDKIGE